MTERTSKKKLEKLIVEEALRWASARGYNTTVNAEDRLQWLAKQLKLARRRK